MLFEVFYYNVIGKKVSIFKIEQMFFFVYGNRSTLKHKALEILILKVMES